MVQGQSAGSPTVRAKRLSGLSVGTWAAVQSLVCSHVPRRVIPSISCIRLAGRAAT